MRKVMGRSMEEDFTFQCMGCWKVECLIAELARLNDIVKGMEMRMTKETNGIESDDMEKGRTEQYSEKNGDDRRLRGGRASARKTNGERTTKNMTYRKVTGEKVTVEKKEERRRKDKGKKGRESRCVEMEVNNRDDYLNKRGREERNKEEGEVALFYILKNPSRRTK